MWSPALAPPSKVAPPRFGRWRALLFVHGVLFGQLLGPLVPGVQATTYNWAGLNPSSPNWTSSLNWDVAGVPPSNGTADVAISLFLPAPPQQNSNVNAAWSIHGLTLGGTIASDLSGSLLTIGGVGITKTTLFSESIHNDIALATDQVWLSNGLVFFGNISLGAHALNVDVP